MLRRHRPGRPPARPWHHLVARDLPGVSANLQDHLDICTLVRSTQPIAYTTRQRHANSRCASCSSAAASALIERSRGRWLRAFALRAGRALRRASSTSCGAARRPRPQPPRGLRLHRAPARWPKNAARDPPAFGRSVRRCRHPRELPERHGRRKDLRTMVEGARLSREILAQASFEPYRGAEIFPAIEAGPCRPRHCFIRRKAETIYTRRHLPHGGQRRRCGGRFELRDARARRPARRRCVDHAD